MMHNYGITGIPRGAGKGRSEGAVAFTALTTILIRTVASTLHSSETLPKFSTRKYKAKMATREMERRHARNLRAVYPCHR